MHLGLILSALAAGPLAAHDFNSLGALFDRSAAVSPPPAVFLAPDAGLRPEEADVVKELAAAEGRARKAWPGYELFDQPVLMIGEGGRGVLIGHPNPPNGFRAAAVPEASRTVFASDGPFRLDGPFSMKYPLGGVDVYAQPLDISPSGTAATAVHERFHGHQDRSFKAAERPELPDASAEELAWAGVEQKALGDALAGDAGALEMFAAVRAERYRRFGEEVRKMERWEERNEGTAAYVEMAAVIDAERRDYYFSGLRRAPEPDEMGKGRFYATGAAQGLLLDRRGIAWKARVEKGEGPYDILAASLPAPPAALADTAKKRYDYDAMLKEAERQARERKEGMEGAIRRFEAAPGLRVRIGLVWGEGVQSGFRTGGPHYELGGYTTLFDPIGTYSFKGDGIDIAVSGRMLRTSPDAAVFPMAREGAAFELDGEPWAPVEGEHAFASLRISGEGVRCFVSGGTVAVRGGRIEVRPSR